MDIFIPVPLDFVLKFKIVASLSNYVVVLLVFGIFRTYEGKISIFAIILDLLHSAVAILLRNMWCYCCI